MTRRMVADDQVRLAQAGDTKALEAVVAGIQDRMYQLAARMLVNPEDAREATQEILILIVTKLSTFRGESAFSTWAYRVATNHLLSARKIREKDPGLTFDLFKADLETGLVADPPVQPDEAVMLNELRISCTMAMLLCLDLNHRIAYVIGDILEFDHGEAAQILGISSANFRKRLSRARDKVVAFTSSSCGLVSDRAKCSCRKRLPAALDLGRVSRDAPLQRGAASYQSVIASIDGLVDDLKTLKLQQNMPPPICPPDVLARITEIIAVPD